MSDQDGSEEKTLPATEHSLRKAREKGQVASSRDFVTAIVTLGGLFYVAAAWQSFIGVFSDGVDFAALRLNEDFSDTYRLGLIVSIFETLKILIPLMVMVVVTVIVSNLLHKRGIPFSMHPVTPDFKKINPASGFKKIFGARGMSEFAVSLVKISIWFALACLLVWQALAATLNSAVCGLSCEVNVANDLIVKIVIAAAIFLIIGGILDLPLQVALFRRENRMSHSQLKREIKETMGTPEYKNMRKEAHRNLNQQPAAARGASTANLVIKGVDVAIALRFDAKDAPVPVVVVRGRGTQSDDILRNAEKLGLPVEDDAELAEALYRGTLPGQQIQERLFQSVALLVIKHKLA